MPAPTAPPTICHPSFGAKETYHPPESLASGFEDLAIVRASAHFTKPTTQLPKPIPKSPYNYEPRTSLNSPNANPIAATVRASSTYGVKEDDVLSLCCSTDFESTPEDYAVPPADKLPCPTTHEDISLELAEKKRATYLSDYPIINKITSKSHGLKVHNKRSNPLVRVADLDPEFKSMYQQVQNKVKQTENNKKPSILAYISPLEEHLLHYLPLKVKKTVVPEGYRPLQYKTRYINDTNLISLGEAVFGRLKNGLKTILF